MTTFRWDTGEIDRLAVDLSEAPGRIQRKAPKVFETAAFKTKQNLKRMASGHDYLPGLDSQVEYERLDGQGLDYEIGFNKVGQGNLANIAVFGSVNNAPIMGSPADALRMELPAMLRHLSDEAEDSVLGTER